MERLVPTPAEIRKATDWLGARDLIPDISPRLFTSVRLEFGYETFAETMDMLGALMGASPGPAINPEGERDDGDLRAA